MQALLRTPSDAILDALFVQSLVGCASSRGENAYLAGLRRYSDLLVAELQAQVDAAEKRERRDAGRRRKVRVRVETKTAFTFTGQCPGRQMRGDAKFCVPDQVAASPAEFDGNVIPVIHESGAKGWGIVRAELSEPGRPVVALR